MEKKILLFHVEKEKRQQIEILCASQGIVPVAVERKQYGDPLGSLAGIPGLKKRGKDTAARSFREKCWYSSVWTPTPWTSFWTDTARPASRLSPSKGS